MDLSRHVSGHFAGNASPGPCAANLHPASRKQTRKHEVSSGSGFRHAPGVQARSFPKNSLAMPIGRFYIPSVVERRISEW